MRTMVRAASFGLEMDRPGPTGLRAAFFSLWFVDLVATICFFVVPYASELNPITVFLYQVLGFPGVVIAAISYAVIVIAIGHALSRPLDVGFVAVMVALYATFASSNVYLLLFGESLLETIVF